MSIAARKIRLVMQMRNDGITDTAVLSAIERVPREAFVPDAFRDRAYANQALPIGAGQTISQPLVVARMTQALELDRRVKVLEVGTGSGYQAAILALLCRRVYSIERSAELLRQAEARFATLGLHNVTTRLADGAAGWPEQAPFRRILMTAAAPDLPAALMDQLSNDGILVAPVGPPHGEQMLVRVRRNGGALQREDLGPVRFVPLVAGRLGVA